MHMSEGIRPLKRARSEEDSPGPVASGSTGLTLQNLKRHEELWFDDGNLILIARGTGFRIYGGLLASQSTIFSDMLLSSSTSAEETLDGCPTVHVSDSPEDLAHHRKFWDNLPTIFRITVEGWPSRGAAS